MEELNYLDFGNDNFENENKNQESKEKTSQEKKEELVILGLAWKWITYGTLKNLMKEIKEKKKYYKIFEDEEILKQIEKLEKELNKKAFVVKVKDWDNLWKICYKYYGKWSISIKILIPKLWYKENIKVWEKLPLPLKKFLLPLLKENDNLDWLKEWIRTEKKNLDWLGKVKNTWEWEKNSEKWKKQNQENKENLQKENKKEWIKIDIEKAEKKLEEDLMNKKEKLINEYTKIYGKYLENYANNMNFASFRDDYKKLKEVSKYIKESKKIDLNELKIRFSKVFDEDDYFYKSFIKLVNELNKLKGIKTEKELKEEEITILKTLREIDKKDEMINWNYEMPIEKRINELTEKEVKKENKELKEVLDFVDKLKELDGEKIMKVYEEIERKWVWHGHNMRKEKDLRIIEDSILSQLDIKDEKLKQSIRKWIKEFFKWYEESKKKLKKEAEKKAEEELKRLKAWYYIDNMWIERANPNYENMKKEVEEKIYKLLLEKNKETAGKMFYKSVKESFVNNYIERKENVTELEKMYSQIKGLRWYTSDKDEEKYKYWTKEILIQTAMMIPSIRLADYMTIWLVKWTQYLEKRAGEKIIESYGGRKAIEYTANWIIFTENYNIEDTYRVYKEDLLNKEWEKISKWDIFLEKFKDVETTVKNIIMLWWLRFLYEYKMLIENKSLKIEKLKKWDKNLIEKTEEQIGQKFKNKYTSYIAKKTGWVLLETGVAYSLWSLWNVVFGEDIQTEKDFLFGLAMVISLRASWKPVKELEEWVIKITRKWIERFKLDKNFKNEWKIKNEEIAEILTNSKRLKEEINKLVKNLLERFRWKKLKELVNNKDQRKVNSAILEYLQKMFGIKKWEKISEEDKQKLKYMLWRFKIKLWELTNNKWEEWQWGNDIKHGYMEGIRFGEVIKIKWWEKILEKIIKGLKEKWYDLKEKKVLEYVEWKIKELVDEKFNKLWKNKEIQDIDKKQIVEDLMWKYMKMVKEIEKINKGNKDIKEKIKELADKLEKIDKVEYKEIIDALRKKVEGWDKVEGDSNKYDNPQ